VQSVGEKNGKPWARVLAYVNNRAVMQRLDDVVGPDCWSNEFTAGPAGGVICGLSIYCERPAPRPPSGSRSGTAPRTATSSR
jgi:hypothetical protein